MKKLFIIKAGSTFTATAERYGDFDELIQSGLGLARQQVRVVNAPAEETLPEPQLCGGVVISGAHCMVTDDLPWSLAIEAWIPRLISAGVPLLGICYGHQLLGRAMGGLVGYHPQGREIGSVEVRRRPECHDDPLFAALPQRFPVHATHAQSVLTLPPGAVHLLENTFEAHHAFRIGGSAWGVQFHPEYTSEVMRDYLLNQASGSIDGGAGIDLNSLPLQETPHASDILKNFARLATGRTASTRA